MAHITAFLIVLTLTGQPVANALCVSWCDSPSERQACGDAIAPSMSAAIALASSTCVALLTESPFLREEGRSALQIAVVLHGVQAMVSSPLGGTRPANIRSRGEANAGRSVPTLVLRV
jgi:hypothetical protein